MSWNNHPVPYRYSSDVYGLDLFKHNKFSDWLYDGWNKEKYDVYVGLNSIGPLRDYMDYLLDIRADSEYLNRYGMDYSDIHDPRTLRSSQSASRVIGSTMSMISKNIHRLYD